MNTPNQINASEVVKNSEKIEGVQGSTDSKLLGNADSILQSLVLAELKNIAPGADSKLTLDKVNTYDNLVELGGQIGRVAMAILLQNRRELSKTACAVPSKAIDISEPKRKGITGPFQLNWVDGKLHVRNVCDFRLPGRFVGVLKAFWLKNGSKRYRTRLSYLEIALLYKRGSIEETSPNADEAIKKERFGTYRTGIEKDPAPAAHSFARDFNRWLKSREIPKELILRCNREAKVYELGSGWCRYRPVINLGEPRTVAWNDLDRPSKRKLAIASHAHLSNSSEEQDRNPDSGGEGESEIKTVWTATSNMIATSCNGS